MRKGVRGWLRVQKVVVASSGGYASEFGVTARIFAENHDSFFGLTAIREGPERGVNKIGWRAAFTCGDTTAHQQERDQAQPYFHLFPSLCHDSSAPGAVPSLSASAMNPNTRAETKKVPAIAEAQFKLLAEPKKNI
jgi:hypothetical protein